MNTKPTPSNNPDANNSTSGTPPWYPPDYPEWLVSESCLLVLWGIMSGNTLTKIDEAVIAKFRELLAEVLFDRTRLTPGFIREMVLAINPGATEDDIRSFLRGIVETFVLHQGCDLPKSKRFMQEYPEFQAKADWNNSAEAAYATMAFAGILLASTKEAKPETSP